MAEPESAEVIPIIFDACCLFTIFGSQRPQEILKTLATPICVCEYVMDEEVIEIFSGPADDERSQRDVISLQPLIDAGLIRVVALQEEEQTAFIRIARDMDDGEARTLAIAGSREYCVATDDRKALRYARKNGGVPPTITTPDFVKHWADATTASGEAVARVLTDIEVRSRYVPARSHPLFEWWNGYTS